jgi:hypothetical protein
VASLGLVCCSSGNSNLSDLITPSPDQHRLPINFQFAAFSVLVLFYAEDVRKRKGEGHNQRLTTRKTSHRIYYGVNLFFSITTIGS